MLRCERAALRHHARCSRYIRDNGQQLVPQLFCTVTSKHNSEKVQIPIELNKNYFRARKTR